MKQKNKCNEKETINMIWNRPLTMSEESQQKLQDAYDQVLAQCAAKNRRQSSVRRRQPLRHLAAASLAAVMLVGTAVAATAAMGYFSKNTIEEAGTVTYEFSLDYSLQPVEVSAVPRYLPDGMETSDSEKFFHTYDDSKSISILPYTMLNIDMMESQMNFSSADKVEHTTIQNMEADILTANDDQKYQYGKNILLFNPDEGYVIWLWGDYGVPVDELKKVAENLDITVNKDTSLAYNQNDELRAKEAAAQNVDTDYAQFIENGVKAEDITALGQELDCAYAGAKFRINNVNIYDSLYDVPGYTEKGVYSMENLTPWLREDGTHKSYLRSCFDGNGNVIKEESVCPKFMAVDITVSQYTENNGDSVAMDACLILMGQQKDGIYHWLDYDYAPVPSENYNLQLDKRCFYLSQPEHLEGDARFHSFFYRNLKAGDTITYTIVFAVDEDILSDESTELFLQFNASGGDAFMTDYCALK